jgi:hypothetical protein
MYPIVMYLNCNVSNLMYNSCAALSVRSPFVAPLEQRAVARTAHLAFEWGKSDHLSLLEAYNAWLAHPHKHSFALQVLFVDIFMHTAHHVTLLIMLHCSSCTLLIMHTAHHAHCSSCYTALHVTLLIMLHCSSCYTAHHVTLLIMLHCSSCYTALHVTLLIKLQIIITSLLYQKLVTITVKLISLQNFLSHQTMKVICDTKRQLAEQV